MAEWTTEKARKFRAFKGALTRARNRKDWSAVIAVAREFDAYFAANGPFPDDWARFERAREDAEFELRRAGAAW